MELCCSNVALVALVLALLIHGEVFSAGDQRGRRSLGDSFDENYRITWGNDHVSHQGSQVQLSLDQRSGAGFISTKSYGSGFFHLRIKLPPKDSAGVITAFYLSSKGAYHDELDFEFLGNKEGKPITLQTNVFAYGEGNREQRMLLWFDPTVEFHSYKILWNPYQIVFYVDRIPIRVFKNNTKIGVKYPSHPMQVEASLWNGDEWATDGGQTKTNWSHGPFRARFEGFDIEGCTTKSERIQDGCDLSKYWWNGEKYWALSSEEKREYESVRKKYVNYDYCNDKPRFPVLPPECSENE